MTKLRFRQALGRTARLHSVYVADSGPHRYFVYRSDANPRFWTLEVFRLTPQGVDRPDLGLSPVLIPEQVTIAIGRRSYDDAVSDAQIFDDTHREVRAYLPVD